MTAVSADKHDAAAPRLLDEVRVSIRLKHYNLRKEQAYLHWINRFIFFHDHLHPRAMGAVVEKFSPYPLRRSCFVIDAKSSVSLAVFSLPGSAVCEFAVAGRSDMRQTA